MADDRRVFPETDQTRFVLRTKSAPLSETGTHEVIAMFKYKADALAFAHATYGARWRRDYEVQPKVPK